MSLSFVAVDVETAAARWDSICSIALVRVVDSHIVDEFYTLINPECTFDPMNTHVNGIRPDMVIDAPTFGEIADTVQQFIGYSILVAHNISFDGSAITKSFTRYGLKFKCTETFCTLKFAQALKKQEYIFLGSLRLSDLCIHYNIPLDHHHNALEDARACAQLLLAMAKDVHATSFTDLFKISTDSSKYLSSKTKTPEYPFKTSPIDLWALGDDLRKKGRLAEAINLLNQSKAAGNDSPALYESLAKAYHKLKDYETEVTIIDEFLAGKTYGHDRKFIERKGKAVAALQVKIHAENKALERKRDQEAKAHKLKETPSDTKSPRTYSGRQILQLSRDGTLIKVHDTIAAAVRDTGISSKSIRDAANGIQKHAGGFCWKYAD